MELQPLWLTGEERLSCLGQLKSFVVLAEISNHVLKNGERLLLQLPNLQLFSVTSEDVRDFSMYISHCWSRAWVGCCTPSMVSHTVSWWALVLCSFCSSQNTWAASSLLHQRQELEAVGMWTPCWISSEERILPYCSFISVVSSSWGRETSLCFYYSIGS